MIRLLRFVGVLNAALWFGAALFFTFWAGPAVFSKDMEGLLRTNYPYFSGAIAQIIIARYFQLQATCSIVALLHLLAEWLYLGRSWEKLWLGLVLALISLNLAGGFWLQPRMKRLHAIKYDPHSRPADVQAAAESFRSWHGASMMVNLIMIAGLGGYLWRAANPSDPTRFVSTSKFRG